MYIPPHKCYILPWASLTNCVTLGLDCIYHISMFCVVRFKQIILCVCHRVKIGNYWRSAFSQTQRGVINRYYVRFSMFYDFLDCHMAAYLSPITHRGNNNSLSPRSRSSWSKSEVNKYWSNRLHNTNKYVRYSMLGDSQDYVWPGCWNYHSMWWGRKYAFFKILSTESSCMWWNKPSPECNTCNVDPAFEDTSPSRSIWFHACIYRS